MKGIWAIPVLASILILGSLGFSQDVFSQLCPVTGCLTDNLYVSDFDLDTVRQYDSDGNLIKADFITDLIGPRGIAFDSTGNLYVANAGVKIFQAAANEGTIRQYDSAGTLIKADFITGLSNPGSIEFDSTGNLYVANLGVNPCACEGTVGQYDSAGTLIKADFAPGLKFPQFIAFDSTGNLYVVDSTQSSVRQYDSTGGLIKATFTSVGADYRGIAFDSTGKLYVAFNNGKVRQFDSDGNLIKDFATGLTGPSGIAFDSTGKFYVSDVRVDTIRQYDSAGGLIKADFITGLSLALFIAFDTLQTPETPSELIDSIEDLGLPSNVENSLKAPLKNAQDKLDDDNPKNDGAACGKMDAFINQVNAQEGKKLTTEQADELREAAQSVKDSIGC
ncbi:MAG: NHL repeat-containing protein [Thaumarchaeota archaeon]|nr:NHL repeat-containing protein [Nitrososphaerota archaeon]